MSERKVNWTEVHQIADEESRVAVVIQRSDSYVPRYSIRIGRLAYADDKFVQYLSVRVDNAKDGPVVAPLSASILPVLEKAERWIEEDAAARAPEELPRWRGR